MFVKERGGSKIWLNYQFQVKEMFIFIQQFCAGNTVSKLKWKQNLQKFPKIVTPPETLCLTFTLSKSKDFQSGALMKMPPLSPYIEEFGPDIQK